MWATAAGFCLWIWIAAAFYAHTYHRPGSPLPPLSTATHVGLAAAAGRARRTDPAAHAPEATPPVIKMNEDPREVLDGMQASVRDMRRALARLGEDLLALRIEDFPADTLFVRASALSNAETQVLSVSAAVRWLGEQTARQALTAAIPLLEQAQLLKKPRGRLGPSQNQNHTAAPIKLQLGAAGDSSLLGWLNVDLLGGRAERTKAGEPAEISINIAHEQLPLEDKSVSHVYAAHVLEHLEFPDELFFALREIHRVLQPGGRFRLVVPDASVWMRGYAESCALGDHTPHNRLPINTSFWIAAKRFWPSWEWERAPLLSLILTYLGSLRSDGNPHKNGYDADLMVKILEDAGFGRVGCSTFMGSDDPVLQIDDTSEAAQAVFFDPSSGKPVHFSLFMEAHRWYSDTHF